MAHGQGGAEIGIDHGPTLTCNHEAPIVAHSLRAEGFDASEDGAGRGTPLVPVPHPMAIQERAVCENPNAGPDGVGIRTDGAAYTLEARTVSQAIAFDCLAGGETGLSVGEVPGALHGGGKSGGRSAVAFDCKGTQVQHDDSGVSPTLRAMGHADSHANAGGQLAVAFAENSRAELRLCGGDGQVSSQLTTGGGKPGQGQATIALPWAVRRLTPRECERLQGFPDDFTLVPVGNRMAADGPRYKALGNSMAVNVMEWIGERIDMVEALP